MEWDVIRSGVLGVVAKTGAACDTLAATGTAISAAANQAGAGSGSPLVSSAATGFGTALADSVKSIVALVDSCENAATTSVNIYGGAQNEMAGNAAAASGSAPDPDMPGRGPR